MGKGHRDPNGNGHFIFPLKKLEHMESLMFASIPRTQIEEYIYEEEEPYSFIERNGEIGWKKENLKRMFCKGNTATCLPSMVIGASHPVAMWKADKLSSYCQGPRGACRRYSASLAFRAPIQRSGSNFIDTRKLSKNNLPLKCGNLKCELPNTMQSSIDIFIPFPRPLCIE
ncbi:uncharacterized protein LOC118012471 isoform X6 [Mirounga leonina]|uniref:uncharacterized protein LOC118012471 isoform X6 n=1 Tax=Mirounga leonina TaxID=9715 RepID=UPI00156BF5B2|nr:uncharacterized protein LOC118012471 isoform X6 [Mirounga leonina]